MKAPLKSTAAGRALRHSAGKVLIAGLKGTSIGSVEAAWLKLIRPAGIILFRRNIESAGQTYELLKAAGESADAPLFRCVDVEGGTVDRLRDLVAPMPSAAAVGATGNPNLFREHGQLIGRELRLLGFNTAFAPVLDLRTASSENVMTTRVVSDDPAEVVRYARYFLLGLAKENVLGCGKHFPGLGGGRVDSHHSTPRIQKAFHVLWQEDLLPYRKLTRQLPLVMISHAAYPQTHGGTEPASISRFWTTEILVKRIGFGGLIVSDDMEMGGILSQTCIADAAIRAVLAGSHLIEICRDPALVLAAFESLLTEAERSPSFARKLQSSAAAVTRYQQKHLKTVRLHKAPAARAVLQAGREIHRFSERLTRQTEAKRA
jgi:beta-N-acetylhexosaminidase